MINTVKRGGLAERIAQANAKHPLCATCGTHHAGASWSSIVGWHDAPGGPTVDQLIPQPPFTRRALAGQLPPKVTR